MREVSITKLGRELANAVDLLGVNHKGVRRATKRVKSAKLHYKLELRKAYSDGKDYAK